MAVRERYDALIAGGGYAGLAMALALVRAGAGLRVAVIERASGAIDEGDPRAMAVSQSSKRLLEAIGVWRSIAPDAQEVLEITITDSALEAGIRPALLTYRNMVEDELPGAYIVPNNCLVAALQREIAAEQDVVVMRGAAIRGLEADARSARLRLGDGGEVEGALVIGADGRGSFIREAAGIKSIGWDYGQTGIVTVVAHERPHEARAVQHFLPGGPFAILPLKGNRSCVTWSEKADVARCVLALDDADFLAEVDQRFGGMLGALSLDGGRASWPLSLHLARSYVARRVALIGDAAHAVHPIAGQGLNLAFRDVAALTEVVVDSARLGFDAGDGEALHRYERWRRFDAATAALAFDGLNRIFRPDIPLVRSVREVGLGIVDRLPFVKRVLVSEAAGMTGELPKLLRGERV
ncbi:MAG: hypothetical protein RLZ98_2434 [Pseudomonadota bacterium]|jgi:2-octaprenyl-6-methoxyphenol hydroxylase